jgi:hypothetical protein
MNLARSRSSAAAKPTDSDPSIGVMANLAVATDWDRNIGPRPYGHTVEECARTYTHLFDEYRDARPVPAEDLIRSARAQVEQGRAAL